MAILFNKTFTLTESFEEEFDIGDTSYIFRFLQKEEGTNVYVFGLYTQPSDDKVFSAEFTYTPLDYDLYRSNTLESFCVINMLNNNQIEVSLEEYSDVTT